MGIRFLLGRAGTGKSDQLIAEVKKKLFEKPQGPSILYIVPEQMTFEQEYTLFNDEKIPGSMRAQVVSFSRLAFRVLQETGGSTKQFISSIGIQMMLRKIIEEKQADWKVFRKAVEKQGFLKELENMITEFKRYQITPEMLNKQINEIANFRHLEPGEIALSNKLNDLTYIYENITVALQNQYIDAEDQLQLLANKINETIFLNDAEIYIEGFHGFTPQEMAVIEALMKKCKSITFVLTVDPEKVNQISELDLFYQSSETYHSLREMANENQIPIDDVIHLDQADGKFKDKPYFDHLERYFDVRPSPPYENKVPLQIAEAVHPRAEVEGVAQEIIRLVRDDGYRFKDVAIFIRETDVYDDLIATIFQDYHIPLFIDEKKTMLNHPLIEFIRSLFDIVESNWRYDAVFRLLKTGFIPATDSDFPLSNDAIDELENYVLEYGIRSRERWTGSEEWVFKRFQGFDETTQTDSELEIQKRINRYRDQVVQAIQSFDQKISHASSIRELCEITYLLLIQLDVPKRLEQMQERYDEEGQIEKGREQEQAWNAVIQVFDEIVEIAGDEKTTLVSFRTILDAGFESLTFSHVPPSIDHVIVGTIDRSRISGVKCVFLLGVNDGVWPMKPSSDGMINEHEREMLSEHGIQLAESSRRKLLDDWFYIYLVMTAAEDHLWVSYLLSDEEGKTKMPSQLIGKLQDLFPFSQDPFLLQDPDDLFEADHFITTPFKTRSALTSQLARNQKGYPMKSIWMHVLNWYIKNHSKHSTTHTVLQSLYYENNPVNLTQETIQELYPKTVKTSVSRLEMYYRCSYQHFAQYSLGLEERKTYKLDAPDIGQLFHEALKTITEWLQLEGRDFAELSKKDTTYYAKKSIVQLAPVLQHQILYSSNRYQYIQKKLQDVIARATFVLSEQARLSSFSPVGVELGFGENQTLKPLMISLPNGFELLLRGRIDRVDQAVNNEELFLRIVDYKSSTTRLNLVEVYYGLAMQMLTYLDVVLSQSEQWLGRQALPAGMLYFHVHNAMLLDQQKHRDENIADELLMKYKMQGLLTSNEELIKMMDLSLDSGNSQIIPAGLKKDGGFYQHSKVANDETFSSLQNHIHELIVQAGIDMTTGGVHLNPYEHKQNIACTYCSFKSVCQFDSTLEENKYRHLNDLKDKDVLAKLHDKEEEDS